MLVTVHAALLLRLHTTSKSSSAEWTQDKVAVGVDGLEAALFHVKSSESRLNDVLSHIDKILCNNFFFFFFWSALLLLLLSHFSRVRLCETP